MKNCSKIIYGILSCMILFACQNDEPDEIRVPSMPQPESPRKMLYDGHEISAIGLYCIEKDSKAYKQRWWLNVYEGYDAYCPQAKTIKDYSNMDLYLYVKELNPNRERIYRYGIKDKDEIDAIMELEYKYYDNRISLLADDYDKFLHNVNLNPLEYKDTYSGWPQLFTAYVNGDVTITCDKILYGEQPGTNLSKYFNVISLCGCLPVGIELLRPEYHFGEELPLEMEKFFIDRAMVQRQYHLQFREQPTEKYDNLTFYISIPMTIEHSLDYVVAKYKGYDLDSKYTETEFKAECPINFNWD